MQEKLVTPVTEKEYLAWERVSEVKHEISIRAKYLPWPGHRRGITLLSRMS